MTGSNWQADMMDRLDGDSAAAGPAAASAPPAPPVPSEAPAPPVSPTGGQPYQQQHPGPTMAPPPAPTGPGWGAPQSQYPPQGYDQARQQQYGPPPQQQNFGPPPQQQNYGPPPQQQYGPPPQASYGPAPQQWQPPPPQGYYPPPYNEQQYGPPPQYQPPAQPPPYQAPVQQPPYGPMPTVTPAPYDQPYQPQYGPPPQEATGWDTPAPDAGPAEAQAYTPTYHDPLAGGLPVATDTVGLQHEEQPESGGFLRRIGRFAAEAAYIAGASGRMQRDVENIAMIRRPIAIGRLIGVIGPVPQSGTSTVTALLADTFATQRSDLVLAVDACPREGKLTHRLDQGVANTPGSRVQLARAEPTPDAISDVLATRNVGGANQVPLSLVDCPAGLFDAATAYVAGSSHAVALVVPSSRDGAPASIDQLDQLTVEGQQMLVHKGLVVITETHPDDPEPVRWLQSAMSARGLAHVVLPYDPHLSRAWPLRPEQLEPATRRAALELAARLIERATR